MHCIYGKNTCVSNNMYFIHWPNCVYPSVCALRSASWIHHMQHHPRPKASLPFVTAGPWYLAPIQTPHPIHSPAKANQTMEQLLQMCLLGGFPRPQVSPIETSNQLRGIWWTFGIIQADIWDITIWMTIMFSPFSSCWLIEFEIWLCIDWAVCSSALNPLKSTNLSKVH